MRQLKTKGEKREIAFRKAAPEDAAVLTATRRKVWDATYRGIYPDGMIDDYAYETHLARDETASQT